MAQEICDALAALSSDAAAAAKELKRVLALIRTHVKAGSPLDGVAACVVELLVAPRPYSVHTVLKACVTAICDGCGQDILREAGLGDKIMSLAGRSSLWPFVEDGTLRNGAMPGWLDLLLDVPQAQPLLCDATADLLRLLASSLHEAAAALAFDPTDATACAYTQEICKTCLLILRVLGPHLRELPIPERLSSEAKAGHALVTFPENAAATKETVSAVAMQSLVLTTSTEENKADLPKEHSKAAQEADSIVASLRALCSDVLMLVLLRARANDTAALSASLSCAHLLCAIVDSYLPSSDAAICFVAFVRCARLHGDGALVVALRGVLQGGSTSTLYAPRTDRLPLPSTYEDRLRRYAMDARLRNASATSAAALDNNEVIWPDGLVFNAVGGQVLAVCTDCVDATHKLFAFRALEALLSHVETRESTTKQPPPPPPPQQQQQQQQQQQPVTDAETDATRPLLCWIVQLCFDHWELSFQSLTGMLPPLLKRTLALISKLPWDVRYEQSLQLMDRAEVQASKQPTAPSWLIWLLQQLHQMDWMRRAKYRTLQAAIGLVPRGVLDLLELWPDLLRQCFQSLSVSNYSSHCEMLLTEIMRSFASHEPTSRAAWVQWVLSPFIEALRGASVTHTESIFQCALPAMLTEQPASLAWLQEIAEEHIEPSNRLALGIALLKNARAGGLLTPSMLEQDGTFTMLLNGLLSCEMQVSHDTLHLLCCSLKLTEAASTAEFRLISAFLPLQMKGATVHSRRQILTAVRKWLHRLKRSTFRSAKELRELQQLESAEASGEDVCTPRLQRAREKRQYARRVAEWLAWFSNLLLEQLYVGTPSARSFLALDLYGALLDNWGHIAGATYAEIADDPLLSLACTAGFDCDSLFSAEFSSRLVHLLLQDFDAIRSKAFELLARFPTGPLPGLRSASEVSSLLHAAVPLLQSARVYESEGGAAVLRLVANRYVHALGWTVRLVRRHSLQSATELVDIEVFEEVHETEAARAAASASATNILLDGIITVVRHGLKLSDLLPPMSGHAHGFLASLRLIASDLDLLGKNDAAQMAALNTWQSRLDDVLELCRYQCDASMAVLCGEEDETIVDGGGGSVADTFLDVESSDLEATEVTDTPSSTTAPGKLKIVLAWLVAKEATLLLGQAMALVVPGRTCRTKRLSSTVASKMGQLASLHSEYKPRRAPLDVAGRSLVAVLLRSRHTGVIERAAQGLALASERLLACDSADLESLPGEWLAALLSNAFGTLPKAVYDSLHIPGFRDSRTDNPPGAAVGQAVTFLRRSAGLPHAAIAVLQAERSGSSSGGRMFAICMAELLHRAGLAEHEMGCDERSEANSGVKPDTKDVDGESSWAPRVHALNLLRMIFLDKTFGLHIMPYVGDGFLVAFAALSTSEWAVRNSGMLLFGALMERALRQRRTREEGESSGEANGIGVRDFFGKAPKLLQFLHTELTDTSLRLEGKSQRDPFPMLLLLGRLVPSPTTTAHAAHGNTIDGGVASLIPLVKAHGAASSIRVRAAAASALVPLVPAALLPQLLASLLDDLQNVGSHNQVHGALLQLKALVAHTVSSGSTLESTTLQQLCLGVGGCVARLSQPCNPVRSAIAQVLSMLARLAPPDAMKSVVAAVQAVVHADLQAPVVAMGATLNGEKHAGASAWRTDLHCLHLYLTMSQPDLRGGTITILQQMLSCADCYEVRLAGVLHTRAVLGLPLSEVENGIPVVRMPSGVCAQDVPIACHVTLGRLVLEVVEAHADCCGGSRACVLHALQLLCDMPCLIEPSELGRAKCTVLALYTRTSDHELRAVALQFISIGGMSEGVWPRHKWLAELDNASSEDRPVLLRVSAARAVGAAIGSNPSRSAPIQVWQFALRLLDDDDRDVREAMAVALSPIVAPAATGTLHSSVVSQLTWMRVADTLTTEELKSVAQFMLAESSMSSQGALQTQPFAVFPAEALNFYREPNVTTTALAYLMGEYQGDDHKLPLGWARREDLRCFVSTDS